jgi:hypothetical protein
MWCTPCFIAAVMDGLVGRVTAASVWMAELETTIFAKKKN